MFESIDLFQFIFLLIRYIYFTKVRCDKWPRFLSFIHREFVVPTAGLLLVTLNVVDRIELCYSSATRFAVFRMKGRSMTIDTVWMFEKDADNLSNTTPRYEGVVLEYRHQVEVSRLSTSRLHVPDCRGLTLFPPIYPSFISELNCLIIVISNSQCLTYVLSFQTHHDAHIFLHRHSRPIVYIYAFKYYFIGVDR